MWLTSATDLPRPMHDIAIAQNPRNLNEIISFGSSLNEQGFIYNVKTDIFKQFDFGYDFKKYCDTKINFTDVYPIVPNCVETNDPNIIILGSFGFCFQFYCVFDTINNKLKPIINKNNSNKNKYYCLSTNIESDMHKRNQYQTILNENICNFKELSFHSFSSKSIIFKNKWLFVSGGGGGGTTPNKHTFTLFEIDAKNDNYNPKLILKINLKNDYVDHGMILYKHCDNNTNEKTSRKKIDIVIFGSFYTKFIKSFVKITFELNEDYTNLIYDNDETVKHQIVYNPIEWVNNVIQHNTGDINDNNGSDDDDDDNNKVLAKDADYYLDANNWPYINNTCFDGFISQFLLNRYLIISGGSHTKDFGFNVAQPGNTLKCFDLKTKKWKIFAFKYTNNVDKVVGKDNNMELKHVSGESLFLDNIDGNKRIHIMGGRRYNNDMKCNFYICINYFEWKYERLVWIAFEKNTKNKSCLLPKLPKEVIKLILEFLKTTSLDQLIKFI